MNDLSIRVSATDMASNVLAAVGDNVKMLGQTTGNAFSSMSANSAKYAQQAQVVTQSNTMIFAGGAGLGLVAKVLTTIAGAGIAAVSAVSALGLAAVNAADKTKKQFGDISDKMRLIEAQRLKISVDVVGTKAIDLFADKLKTISNQLERLTGQSSSKFANIGKDALMLGIDTDQINEAVKASAGLSYAFGVSLEGGLSKVNSAMRGSFEGFEAMIPGIENLATKEEKLAAVSKLASDALQMQANKANDSIGIFSKLSTGFGNLLENVGSGKPMFETFAGILDDMVFPAIDLFDSKIFKLGKSAETLKDTFKTSMAYVATVVELYTDQSSKSFQKLFLQMNLSTETAINRAKFMFNNAGNFATYFKDLVLNVGKLIDSPNPGAFFLKNNQIMPDALKKGPEESAFEKQLKQMISELSGKANDEFDALLKRNLDKINQAMASSKQDFTPPKLSLIPDKGKEDEIAKDSIARSDALQSRVMVRGPADNFQERLLSYQQQQLAILQKIADDKTATTAAGMAQSSNTGFLEVKMIGN